MIRDEKNKKFGGTWYSTSYAVLWKQEEGNFNDTDFGWFAFWQFDVQLHADYIRPIDVDQQHSNDRHDAPHCGGGFPRAQKR